MKDKIYNLVWIGLAMANEGGSFASPLPAEYIENLRETAISNPECVVVLWMDSKRLTITQQKFLEHKKSEMPLNVQIKDLRTIRAYDKENLYNAETRDPNWRRDYHATIWSQVDAARLLVCLECLKSGYKSVAYADMDLKGIKLNSRPLNLGLQFNNAVFGLAQTKAGSQCQQNSFMAFTQNMKERLEGLYKDTLQRAQLRTNGYGLFVAFINSVRRTAQKPEHLMIPLTDIGVASYHPNTVERPKPLPGRESSYLYGNSAACPT
jgi:hypothetical protein